MYDIGPSDHLRQASKKPQGSTGASLAPKEIHIVSMRIARRHYGNGYPIRYARAGAIRCHDSQYHPIELREPVAELVNRVHGPPPVGRWIERRNNVQNPKLSTRAAGSGGGHRCTIAVAIRGLPTVADNNARAPRYSHSARHDRAHSSETLQQHSQPPCPFSARTEAVRLASSNPRSRTPGHTRIA